MRPGKGPVSIAVSFGWAVVLTVSNGCEPFLEVPASPASKPAREGALTVEKATGSVDANLLRLHGEWQRAGEDSVEAFLRAGFQIRDGRVAIDCRAVGGEGRALLSVLEKLGLREGALFHDTVSGWFPIESIPSLAGVEILKRARAARSTTRS